MANEGDDGQFDDEKEISGTFPVRGAVMEEKKIGSVTNALSYAKAPDYADEMLLQQDIANRRAIVEDGLRSMPEQYALLAKILRTDFIPPKKAQECADEENELQHRVLREIALAEKSGRSAEKLLARASFSAQFVDEARIEREAFAKYVRGKMKRLMEKKKYGDARKVYKEKRFEREAKNPLAVDELDLVCGFASVDAVREVLIKGDAQEVADALFELGNVTNFQPTDFEDLPKEVLRNPKVIEGITQKVASCMKIHPKFYTRVRDYFVKLGFLNVEETDASLPVRGAAIKLLDDAMEKHPVAFAKFRDILDEMGIVLKEEANSLPRIQYKAQNQLAFHMKNSPEIYIKVRDRYAELGIIDPQKMDADPEIQKLFYGHLLCWKDVHISLHGKFRFRWSLKGLSEPDWKKLNIDPTAARKLVLKGGSNFDELDFSNCREDFLADRVLEAVKDETQRVHDAVSTWPYIERIRVEDISKKGMEAYHDFVADYDQFRYGDKVSEELKL